MDSNTASQSLQHFQIAYTEIKYWLPAISFLWAIFRGLQWVKTIKTNDLHHIQLSVNDLKNTLDRQTTVFTGAFEKQTTALVREFGEMRSDFRAFYPQPVRAKKARAAKAGRRKK